MNSSRNGIGIADKCVENPPGFCADEEEANVEQVEVTVDSSMNHRLTSATDDDSQSAPDHPCDSSLFPKIRKSRIHIQSEVG